MRVILLLCCSTLSYNVGTDYVVTRTVVPEEERRERVIDKKPVKIIKDELFREWMDTLLLNDWIEEIIIDEN